MLSACQILGSSDRDNDGPQYFTAEYGFINTSDDTLDAVELLTGTYFPDKDITRIRMENHQDIAPYDSLGMRVDSIQTGSLLQIGVEVYNEWNNGRRAWRTYILKRDTVRSADDRTVAFRWPEDTLQAERYTSRSARKQMEILR